MTQIRIKDGVLLQKVAQEMVLLDPASGDYFTLNEVGAIIVEQSQHGQTKEQVSDYLVNTFDVDKTQAEQDIKGILAQLVEEGLAESL